MVVCGIVVVLCGVAAVVEPTLEDGVVFLFATLQVHFLFFLIGGFLRFIIILVSSGLL